MCNVSGFSVRLVVSFLSRHPLSATGALLFCLRSASQSAGTEIHVKKIIRLIRKTESSANIIHAQDCVYLRKVCSSATAMNTLVKLEFGIVLRTLSRISLSLSFSLSLSLSLFPSLFPNKYV